MTADPTPLRDQARSPSARRPFEWEEVGDVAVVRFLIRSLRDEQQIIRIFDDLVRLAAEAGRTKFVLNFGGVDAFASYAVGRLVSLHRQLQTLPGRLALCNVTPGVADILKLMKLRKKFALYATEQDALESFR